MIDEKKNRFFVTGWIMILIAFCMLLVTQAFGLYSFSMLKVPMTATLNVAETQVALGFSFYTIATAIGSLFVGDLIDKIGLRKNLILAALLFSGGFLLLTFISEGSLLLFYLAYFIMGIGSALCGAVIISGIPANWFNKQRGIATAIVWCAMLPGSFVSTSIIAALSANVGWQYAVYILAAISFVVVIVAAFVLRWTPQERGYMPDGGRCPTKDTKIDSSMSAGKKPIGLSRKQALKTPTFWLLFLSFGLCGVCEMGPFQNMPTYLITQGNDLVFSASFMTFLAFAGIVGKLLSGIVIDVFKPRLAFIAVNVLCFVGLALFFLGAKEGVWLYVAGFLFGFALSAAMICFSTATAQYLGTKHYGQIWGLVYLMKPLSDAVGVPLFAGVSASVMGYPGAFLVAIGCLVVCTVGFAFAKKEKALIQMEDAQSRTNEASRTEAF